MVQMKDVVIVTVSFPYPILYIPHGSDESLRYQAEEGRDRKIFISHMVQMKGYLT